MVKILKMDKQCEDRCIIGVLDDGMGILYDGDVFDCGQITRFNFCPGCGQELNITQTKTENGMRLTKI